MNGGRKSSILDARRSGSSSMYFSASSEIPDGLGGSEGRVVAPEARGLRLTGDRVLACRLSG